MSAPGYEFRLQMLRADINFRIDQKCAAEHAKTKRQGEAARRALGQLFRWHGGKK